MEKSFGSTQYFLENRSYHQTKEIPDDVDLTEGHVSSILSQAPQSTFITSKVIFYVAGPTLTH